MYDVVTDFKAECPICGATHTSFQTKNGPCELKALMWVDVRRFYTRCDCGWWLEYYVVKLYGYRPIGERLVPYKSQAAYHWGFSSLAIVRVHPRPYLGGGFSGDAFYRRRDGSWQTEIHDATFGEIRRRLLDKVFC